MKAVMYHYVREDQPDLPYFRHLHVEDFALQLDHFERTEGFVSRADFFDAMRTGVPAPGVVLTFDDGFKDHHRHVLPELTRRGLWGFFFIATAPHSTRKLIDVHRIHLLLGRHGGAEVSDCLDTWITPGMLSQGHVEEFRADTYSRQSNDECVTHVKRTLNYYLDYADRGRVIDRLMERYFPAEAHLVDDFYLSAEEMREMQEAGMILGSHTVNHLVMSRLSPQAQEAEIASSFRDLERWVGPLPIRTFCYPYGGFHSFTRETEAILTRQGCALSFNVEPREIASEDLLERPQALPRFDCNQFPHGSVRAA